MHLKREILRRIRFEIIKNYHVFVNFSKILIIVFKLICRRSSGVITGSVKNSPFFQTRYNFFKHSLFSSTVMEQKIVINYRKLKLFHNLYKNYREIYRAIS